MSSATVSLGHAVSAAHVFGHEFRSSFVSDATRIVLLENCPAYIRKWIMGERR
jgi:hypothetical protein